MLSDKDLVSIQEVRSKTDQAYAAYQRYRGYSQQQVDAIVEHMAEVARANAQRLAEMAVEETGMGNAADKMAKNLLCSDILPRRMRGMRTIGVLRELSEERVIEVAVPVGVVAAILPTTNPTSTAIYKTLVSLKAGNAVVHSPHPTAKNSTCATVALLAEAAVAAGAPDGLIQCINNPTIEGTNALMRHERTGVILSTGGSGIVKAAYSSGKPAFGVGPGNVPVLIDRSADIADAVAKTVEGKKFDYGTVCSSEQTVVAEESLRDAIVAELKKQKAYICDAAQGEALARILLTPNWTVSAKCVGQPPGKIAAMAGFSVPADTSILVAEIKGIGKQHPLSAEKLSPVLSLYFVKDFAAAMDACEGLLRFGGLGHTCVIYATDDARVREFGVRMPAFRVLVSTPAPQGSTGITTNVFPSMTLGCGAMAGNATSDNIGPQHLYNVKRIAYAVRTPAEAFSVPLEMKASSAAAPAPASVDRGTVVAAVDRYLAQRGIAPVPAASSAPVTSLMARPAGDVVTQVVDRFLAGKRGGAAPPAAPAPTCGCGGAIPEAARPADAPATSVPAPPKPVAVDFVCESDVREAIQQKRKIFIGAKTIVTPSARELAGAHDILVLT